MEGGGEREEGGGREKRREEKEINYATIRMLRLVGLHYYITTLSIGCISDEMWHTELYLLSPRRHILLLGCLSAGTLINHLMYADDLYFILQALLV